MGAYDDRPYEVGKGKPPKRHQWKPGQSGNPKGPKRKAKAAEMPRPQLLAVLMNQIVTPVIGGRKVRMTMRQYIMLQNINDAAMGTKFERRKATELLIRMGAFDIPPPDPGNYDIPGQTVTELVEALAAEFGFKAGDAIVEQ